MDARQITKDSGVRVYNVDVSRKGSYFEVEINGFGIEEALLDQEEAVRLRDALNEWLEEKGVE